MILGVPAGTCFSSSSRCSTSLWRKMCFSPPPLRMPFDHRGVVLLVGEDHQPRHEPLQGGEGRIVGDIGRGEKQRRLLAVQIGELGLELDMDSESFRRYCACRPSPRQPPRSPHAWRRAQPCAGSCRDNRWSTTPSRRGCRLRRNDRRWGKPRSGASNRRRRGSGLPHAAPQGVGGNGTRNPSMPRSSQPLAGLCPGRGTLGYRSRNKKRKPLIPSSPYKHPTSRARSRGVVSINRNSLTSAASPWCCGTFCRMPGTCS